MNGKLKRKSFELFEESPSSSLSETISSSSTPMPTEVLTPVRSPKKHKKQSDLMALLNVFEKDNHRTLALKEEGLRLERERFELEKSERQMQLTMANKQLELLIKLTERLQ